MLRVLILGFIIIVIIATLLEVAQSCGSETDAKIIGVLHDVAVHILDGSAAEDAAGATDTFTLQPLSRALGGD